MHITKQVTTVFFILFMSINSASALEYQKGASITFNDGSKQLLQAGTNVIRDSSGRIIETLVIIPHPTSFTQALKDLAHVAIHKHRTLTTAVSIASVGALIAGILWLTKKNNRTESHESGSLVIYAKR